MFSGTWNVGLEEVRTVVTWLGLQHLEQGLEQEGAQDFIAKEGKEDTPLRLRDESCKVWGRSAWRRPVPSIRGEERVAPRKAASWLGP